MKTMCAAAILAMAVGAASPAAADIAEVTTSVIMPASATDEDLERAVNAAARAVLSEIQLQPVMMLVTAAIVSSGRLYVRFLVADEAGARLLGVRGAIPWAREGETYDPDGLRI